MSLRHSIACLALAAGALLAFAPAAAAEEKIHVEVRGSSGRNYQAAVQRFAAPGEAAAHREDLFAAISTGLSFSSVVDVVDSSAFLEPRETVDFAAATIACENWRGIGADLLVEGELEFREGVLVARYRVWDTVRCTEQGESVQLRRARSEVSLLGRTIADDVVARFTGRRGVSATQLAFVSDRTGHKEVYLMEADGARKRAVTSNASINLFPGWSPDGRGLVYTSFKGGYSDVHAIWRGSRGGGVLVDSDDPKYRAVFGPRYGRLALVMNRRGNTDLYTVNAQGRDLQRITTDRAIETSPSWSPDGTKLAFVSDRGGKPQIYIRDFESGIQRRLTYRGSYNASPAWSPTGEWIAYAAQTGTSFDLYLIDPESGFTAPLVVHPRGDEDPAWSPDGRKIAFASTRRGRKEIYRIDVDGRNLTRLTDSYGNCSSPAWSGWLD